MTNRAKRWGLIGLACGLCAGLCGCGARLDESVLNTTADYSIDIALPYATVTPPPAHQQAAQALVIDANGGVTVNDSESILQNTISDASDVSNQYKSLRLGNTGLAVQALQSRLKELNYYAMDVSGIFDAETEGAVRRFEQTFGTMQTGVATADLQARLFSADALVYGSEAYNSAVVSQYKVLQRGDVGSTVYTLQQRLRNLGYPLEELTGIFDNETANAVMLFYEAYGLSASDVANVALQKELYSDSARAYVKGERAAAAASDALNVMTQNSIRQIQQHLIRLGYLSGEADGIVDARTQIAVKLFEEACGQLPSGTMTADVLTRLQSEGAPGFELFSMRYTNLLEGSSGDTVSSLQERLVALGFAKGSPNGEYGSPTTASLKLFQRANGLQETGVADVYTQAVLYSSFARNIDGETVASASTVLPANAQSASENGYGIGSSGDMIYRLQSRLLELGFVCDINGVFDNATSRAVSAFEICIGSEPDGFASDSMLALLYSSAAPTSDLRYHDAVQPFRSLKPGDAGDDVFNLQKRLWELGYLKKADAIDSVGTFNTATGESVRAAQESMGYEVPSEIASVEFQCYLHSGYSKAIFKRRK